MSTMSFYATDTIFATIMSGTNTLARLTLSGCTSMSEVMKSVMSKLQGVAGLVTVVLRNVTNGWSTRQALFVRTF